MATFAAFDLISELLPAEARMDALAARIEERVKMIDDSAKPDGADRAAAVFERFRRTLRRAAPPHRPIMSSKLRA